MTKIYFDVTDIIQHATRYSRLTGIQRVQTYITGLLARKYGGQVISCMFYDHAKAQMVEFDPSLRSAESEFDAERLLVELGLLRLSRVLPSKVQIKSYLRRYNHKKFLRAIKKVDIYLSAIFMRHRLKRMGIFLNSTTAVYRSLPVTKLKELPIDSCYACMGSVWIYPEVMEFARVHSARGGHVIQMVYDLIPISHPENYSKAEALAYSEWLLNSFRYTSLFVSISQWTADVLSQFAGQSGQQLSVVVCKLAHEFTGYARLAKVELSSQLAFLTGRSYVLCVGTIEHRKNGIALLKAWQQLILELGNQTPLLVFAGKYGKGGAEFQDYLQHNADLSAHVKVIHAPSDNDLAGLYSNCLFSTLPSLIEGWGLPVGESAWFGKFCVASNATSVPEVCGAMADYVDPNDIKDMVAGLRRPIVDRAYLGEREAEIARTMLRRWFDVADDIYACIAGNSHVEVCSPTTTGDISIAGGEQ